MRHLRNFALFLYDFIVGDSLVIGIGIPLAVLAAWAVVHLLPESLLPQIFLPAAVILVLALSLRPARSK
jgi:hypothetical protein